MFKTVLLMGVLRQGKNRSFKILKDKNIFWVNDSQSKFNILIIFTKIENSLQQHQQHRLTSTTFVPNGNHFTSNCSSQLANTSKYPNASTKHTPQIDKKKCLSRDNLSTLGLNMPSCSQTISNNNNHDGDNHQTVLYIALYDYKGIYIKII